MIKLIILALFMFFNINVFSQNGILKTYSASGNVASRLSFVDEILEGTSYWYYENGNIKTEKDYSNGKLNGMVKNYYENGLLKSEVKYTNGIVDGVSRKYYDNGGLAEVKSYDFGELVSVSTIEYDEFYIAPLSAYKAGKNKRVETDDFICSIEICPEPVGGIEEIESKLVYPELAKQYNLEGRVLISAVISERGIPKNIEVIKGLGLGCDEAAISAVQNTKFIPGRDGDDEIESGVTFHLNFKLPKTSLAINPPETENLFSEVNQQQKIETTEKSVHFISCDSEVCPNPEGGIMELLAKLRYPPNAKRNNIAGDVIVRAKINELGFVIFTEIVQGLGFGCDEAARSAIIKTQFEPAKNNGVNVETTADITVPFILE